MSTPIATDRRNLVQRIANLLRKGENGEIDLMPWLLRAVQEAIALLEQERFAEGERTMTEAGLPISMCRPPTSPTNRSTVGT
mgnify:FL=1